ncbi:MAG: FtsQ-type POTRA domain-containing protein [Anaerolineae bacterium]|nr:FtsQ-type POTRA domain-containing protein [Anaerolineae bacterium]
MNFFQRRPPPRVKPRRDLRHEVSDPPDNSDESIESIAQQPPLDAIPSAQDLDDLPPLEAPKSYSDYDAPVDYGYAEADPIAAPYTDDEESAESERTSSRGQIGVSRLQVGINVAERRRLRRLEKAAHEGGLPPSVMPRNAPRRVYVSTRWFSALLAALLILVLILFLTNPAFYIREIYVGGTRYLEPAEIFQRSGLANMHLFWVDASQVEAQLRLDPTIADAQVDVGWPPAMIQITVTEREPALIWEQSGQRVWVDVRGRVMQLREDLSNLLRIVVEKPSQSIHLGGCPLQGMDEVLGPGSCIDPDTIAGALQFKALYPDVTELVYDPVKGLGFHDGRGWTLWFGDGRDIEVKMAVYNRIVEEYYTKQGIQFVEVNVSNPDEAYYSRAP